MGIKNKIFDKFSEEVCSQIKCTEIHSDIKDEINSHLEEIKEEYMAEGVAEEDAERQAISHMGDSEKIGFDLNKIYKKSPEYKTLIIGLIFVLLGLFVQITIKISSPPNIIYYNYIKAIIHIILGIAVGIVIYILDYRKLEKYSMKLFIIANIFAVFSLIMIRPVNGISKEIFLKLPFLNSDFIYCYIIYTFGWIAGAIIFALVILLLINLFKTSKLIKSNYGKMLFLSISFLFSIEFLVPMLMNINLVALPIGVSMPFFSYSGTSTIINSALVGVICSIYGRKNLSKSLVRIKDKI